MNRAGPALLFLAAGILAACGRTERKVRIAALTDLTGPSSVYGEGIRRAAALALDDRRGALLAAGWDVNLAVFDAHETAPDLETTARNIAADSSVACAVVQTGSDGNFAASEIFHAAGIANILPAETSSLADPKSQPETFYLSPAGGSHGASDAEWVLYRAAARILVTTDADARALSIAGGFRDAAQTGGATVYTFQINSDQDLSDWTTYDQSIHPDLVYFSGASQLALSLLDRITASNLPGSLFFAQDNPEDILPALFESDSVPLMFSPATPDSAGAAVPSVLLEKYQKAYGSDPPALAALGYDAAALCLAPLLKKGTGDLSPDDARSWVLDQLRGSSIYPELTGFYTPGGGRPCRVPIYIRDRNPPFAWTPVTAPEFAQPSTTGC